MLFADNSHDVVCMYNQQDVVLGMVKELRLSKKSLESVLLETLLNELLEKAWTLPESIQSLAQLPNSCTNSCWWPHIHGIGKNCMKKRHCYINTEKKIISAERVPK